MLSSLVEEIHGPMSRSFLCFSANINLYSVLDFKTQYTRQSGRSRIGSVLQHVQIVVFHHLHMLMLQNNEHHSPKMNDKLNPG